MKPCYYCGDPSELFSCPICHNENILSDCVKLKKQLKFIGNQPDLTGYEKAMLKDVMEKNEATMREVG